MNFFIIASGQETARMLLYIWKNGRRYLIGYKYKFLLTQKRMKKNEAEGKTR